MSTAARPARFERKLPEDRRKILVEATLKCLSEQGQDGLSIRKISAEAGISVGLINHHYDNKEDLVAQAYESLTLSLFDLIKAEVEQAGDNPRAAVSGLIRSMLSKPALDPGTLRCWLVFWGMMQPGNALREVHDRTYGDYRVYLQGLLARLVTESGLRRIDTRLAAIGLLALIDGLWIEWCLNPATFSPDEAIGLCEAWMDALIGANAA